MNAPPIPEPVEAGGYPVRLDPRLMMITAACMLLSAMVALDATVVNVAQRALIDTFSSRPAVVEWTATGYTLSLALVIPLTGWAASRWAPKLLVLGSVVVFTWASLLCSQAPNIALLVAFRALQGLGGGTLLSIQLIILARAAGPERLARVLTISMVPILTAPVCGHLLGGWLIDSFGWQSIFLINVPLGLFAVVFAGFVLPEDIPLEARSLDVIGMLLLSPGLALTLYGVSQLPAHGTVWLPKALA